MFLCFFIDYQSHFLLPSSECPYGDKPLCRGLIDKWGHSFCRFEDLGEWIEYMPNYVYKMYKDCCQTCAQPFDADIPGEERFSAG